MSVISSVLKWPDGLTTDLHMLELDKKRLEAGKKSTPAFTGTPSQAPAPTPSSSAATTNAAKKFAETPEIACHSAPCILP